MPEKIAPKKRMTRQERKDLDIEIGFLEGVVKRDPAYVDALQILGDDYTKRGKFKEGLKVDERLAELRPKDSLVFYNLACSYSLLGEYEKAADALEQSLNLGYRDFKWLAEDPDLEALRKQTVYRKIRAKLRTLKIRVR
ncbi:MAG: TPR end-of-group domain-containing protein [Verrucomicrobiales bacterium]